MKTTLRVFLPVALLAALAACGNKGPLMHPAAPVDDMAAPATMAEPASTAAAAPADATAPVPVSGVPATPTDDMPAPASGGG
jgi:diaminopimelate decarboxylase